jgi:F-type H+-transporting ATPase subunit b
VQIDWITVTAQIVNFLILVWLLRRFLYRPVMDAMAKRERRIADRLEEAARREEDAERSRREHEEAREEFDARREELLDRAREEAERERRERLDAARDETAAARREWQREVEREREDFLRRLRSESAEALREVLGKALAGLADQDLEKRIVEVFLERLKRLDDGEKRRLAEPEGPVKVTSAFELDPATRGRITRAIHEHVDETLEVEYATSSELLGGLEIEAGGGRVGFSLADYVDRLGERLSAALAPGAK